MTVQRSVQGGKLKEELFTFEPVTSDLWAAGCSPAAHRSMVHLHRSMVHLPKSAVWESALCFFSRDEVQRKTESNGSRDNHVIIGKNTIMQTDRPLFIPPHSSSCIFFVPVFVYLQVSWGTHVAMNSIFTTSLVLIYFVQGRAIITNHVEGEEELINILHFHYSFQWGNIEQC